MKDLQNDTKIYHILRYYNIFYLPKPKNSLKKSPSSPKTYLVLEVIFNFKYSYIFGITRLCSTN